MSTLDGQGGLLHPIDIHRPLFLSMEDVGLMAVLKDGHSGRDPPRIPHCDLPGSQSSHPQGIFVLDLAAPQPGDIKAAARTHPFTPGMENIIWARLLSNEWKKGLRYRVGDW